MRIVVWNCNMGLHLKIDRLLELRPDVAIVPECASPKILGEKSPLFIPPSMEWIPGSLEHKGLAVMAWGDFRIRRHPSPDHALRYVLPVEVVGPVEFNVLGVWAMNDFNGMAPDDPGPLLKALNLYRGFLGTQPSVVGGDFNNHHVFDRPGRSCNHANALAEFERLNMCSAYHEHLGVKHGREPDATHFWTRNRDKPFHLDYCFLPTAWRDSISHVEVGACERWIGHSDHMPVVVDLNL